MRSVGCKGDFYHHSLAERIWNVYRPVGPSLGTVEAKGSVKLATLEWLAWLNQHRLREPIGCIRPATTEVSHLQSHASQTTKGKRDISQLASTEAGSVLQTDQMSERMDGAPRFT